MGEMIDRMAKAYWEGRQPIIGRKPEPWEDLHDFLKDRMRADARFVLERMRDATDDMIAGAAPWTDAAGAIEVWRAMVETALK
jgi:hypothetical protein